MASEQEIINALEDAPTSDVKIRILDQLALKIKPQHRDLIAYLVSLSSRESNQEVAYSVKRALFKIRSRYNITNFPLFLMDPIRLLQSSDPACRIKALEVFDKGEVSVEQCYQYLGSIFFEDDPFVLSKMMKVMPTLSRFIPPRKIEKILQHFLDASDSRVRANALDALGTVSKTGDEERFQRVWNCLKDSDQRVRANAVDQILSTQPDNFESYLKDQARSSEDYYELIGIQQLLGKINGETDSEIQSFLVKKIAELEGKITLKDLERVEEIGLENHKVPGGINLSMMQYVAGPRGKLFILICLIACVSFSYRLSQKNDLLLKSNQAFEKNEKVLLQEVKKLEQQIALNQVKTPIAMMEISPEEKLSLLKEEGSSLRENSDLFMTRAKELFEQENYSEASALFRSLYEVYKDNRLAVDSVRWLSKTQKIENILRSVNEYMAKTQYISCRRKLEELRHLVSAKVYEQHLKRIQEAQDMREKKR